MQLGMKTRSTDCSSVWLVQYSDGRNGVVCVFENESDAVIFSEQLPYEVSIEERCVWHGLPPHIGFNK